MPLSRNINTYNDIEAVFQAARKSGQAQCTYRLDTPGQAINWRARAYMYRRLLRDAAAARLTIPGYHPTTAWDDVTLDLKRGSTEVIIRFGFTSGKLIIDGEPVDVAPVKQQAPVIEDITDVIPGPEAETETELEKEARALMQRLGVE